MRLVLVTAGSRGDVEPFVALARRAAGRGHTVGIGVTRDAVRRAATTGVEVLPLDGDYAELVAAQGTSAAAAARTYRTVVRPMMTGILTSAARAIIDFRPDVVVHHAKVLSAPVAATRLGVPHVLAELVPTLTPTRAFPAAGITGRDLGALNPMTFAVARAAGWLFADVVRQIRAEHGLARRGPLPPAALTLLAVSPTLLNRPDDWPETVHVTGAWTDRSVPASQTPLDPELREFLAGGRVVYAGFGSMAGGDSTRRGSAVVEACRAMGRPVLVVTGWGGLTVPPSLAGGDVLVRTDVPHELVLPECDVAVHHAGAGTAHAAVRAGAVSVPVPFLGDQPYWAARLRERGLATPPVPARRVTTTRLTKVMGALPDGQVAAAAAATMVAEDGCAAALDLLERLY